MGYALVSPRQGKTRAKAKASRALPACSESSLPSFWSTRHHVTRWLRVVIDSGCTWHVHNCLTDLINCVPCADVIVDANGHKVTCAYKGDLPLLALDSSGKEFRIVLRGVRYSPSFEDTLISVDQLWYASDIDTRFRDLRHLQCTKSQANGKPLTLPFGRHRGLYMWNVAVAPPKAPTTPPLQLQPRRHAAMGARALWGALLRAAYTRPAPTPMCAPCPRMTSPPCYTAACTLDWAC